MNAPLVSVITITRNRAKLIGRCIQSVLNQTYKNIEHIIVDGASTDETDDIIGSFKDERLKYFKLEANLSVVKTIQYGAAQATGEYICFLDDDDEYVPTKIEKQVKLIESLPDDYGMVYCWMSYFDSSNDNAFMHVHKAELRGFVPVDAAIKPNVSGTPTFMFRKNVYDELGGWAEDMPLTTDWELGARCCQKWKVDYVPESLVNVYVNHIYDRMSTQMRYDKAFLKKRIGMHEYFLNKYKDTYNKQLGSRWYQYKSLAFFCLKDKNIWKTIKYAFLYMVNVIGNFIYEKLIKFRNKDV